MIPMAGLEGTAAGQTSTVIDVSPIVVRYGSMQTTVAGKLMEQGNDQPVSQRTIHVQYEASDHSRTELGTATTGDDGTFSVAVTIPRLGLIDVTFAGDSAYAPFQGGDYTSPESLPTQVTLDPMPASVTGYSWQHVSGTVRMQTPQGDWVPAPDAFVIISGKTTSNTARVRSSGDGRFSGGLSITSVGPFAAHTRADWYSFASDADSPGQSPQIIPTRARITGFTVSPKNPAAQNSLTFTGTSETLQTSGTNTSWVPGGGPVHLYFRPKGSATWIDRASAIVYFPGTVTFRVPGSLPTGRPAAGTWRLGSAPTPIYQGAQSNNLALNIRIRTSLSPLRIKKTGRTRYLLGHLGKQPTSSPISGQTIKLYYRLRGSKTWHFIRTTRTQANGSFSVKLTKTHRWYRAVYAPPATSSYLGGTSSSVYFSA